MVPGASCQQRGHLLPRRNEDDDLLCARCPSGRALTTRRSGGGITARRRSIDPISRRFAALRRMVIRDPRRKRSLRAQPIPVEHRRSLLPRHALRLKPGEDAAVGMLARIRAVRSSARTRGTFSRAAAGDVSHAFDGLSRRLSTGSSRNAVGAIRDRRAPLKSVGFRRRNPLPMPRPIRDLSHERVAVGGAPSLATRDHIDGRSSRRRRCAFLDDPDPRNPRDRIRPALHAGHLRGLPTVGPSRRATTGAIPWTLCRVLEVELPHA